MDKMRCVPRCLGDLNCPEITFTFVTCVQNVTYIGSQVCGCLDVAIHITWGVQVLRSPNLFKKKLLTTGS